MEPCCRQGFSQSKKYDGRGKAAVGCMENGHLMTINGMLFKDLGQILMNVGQALLAATAKKTAKLIAEMSRNVLSWGP